VAAPLATKKTLLVVMSWSDLFFSVAVGAAATKVVNRKKSSAYENNISENAIDIEDGMAKNEEKVPCGMWSNGGQL
jgi:hypothetical protein